MTDHPWLTATVSAIYQTRTERAICIREVEDGLGKISLRTEAPYDASAICQRLGGGGHAAAAGASVPGGIAGAKAAILRALAESGVRL